MFFFIEKEVFLVFCSLSLLEYKKFLRLGFDFRWWLK